jgi:hypothetical protein
MPVETLGDAFSLGWRVHMRCTRGKTEGMKRGRECVYRRELDMATLVCTRGRDFPLARLAERLRCPQCGSREIAVMYDPPASTGRARAWPTL